MAVHFVWRWRSVIGLLLIWQLVGMIIHELFGQVWGTLIEWAVIAFLVTRRSSRQWMVRTWKFWRLRQRLDDVFVDGKLEPFATHPPYVAGVESSGVGSRIELRLRAGTSVADLERMEGHLATALQARAVRVERDRLDASRVWLTVIRNEGFQTKERWPLLQSRQWDFTKRLPLGVDEDGRIVDCELVEHNVLIGGEPGAGKSNALSVIVGAAALDPRVRLHLLDGKLVELAPWKSCATSFVGPEIAEAIALIDGLRASMDRRYEMLLNRGLRKVDTSDPDGYDVVVCDELAMYISGSDKRASGRFADGLRDLVARGRAAGVVVVAATQKPSTDVIPSSIRDLFGYRWAMRCATRDASDTILGAGWAGLGFSASEIDADLRGTGLLRFEGDVPAKLRAFRLSDTDVAAVVGRAMRIRTQASSRAEAS
jgi:DNA segregation ATPase FtsK/SpoIIIE-like protein